MCSDQLIFVSMKKINPSLLGIALALVCSFIMLKGQAQYLVSTELIGTYTAAELNIVPGLTVEFDVDLIKVVYNTVNATGEPVIASGAFAKPQSENCSLFPMAIYQHGTTLNKDDVPSRDNAESAIAKLIGGLGFYALAPDYVGMGDSPGLHPYIHAESEATAGVDMIRAVREYLATLDEMDNGEVLITGYSQGGHAAMAMHKYIEENDLLDEFNVIAAAPASGPYDLSGSQTAVIISGEPYSNPGYIVYTLASYQTAYGNLYSDYSEVLQSPYDGIVVPFFDGNNYSYSMGNLNPQLPQVVSELMTPDFLTAFETDLNHPFRLDLQDNDVYDWTPQRPIRMYYCSNDEQVNYQNSLTAAATMQANGAASVNAILLGPLDHSNCFLPAMLGAVTWFNAISTPCIVSAIDEFSFEFGIYPNPASERIEISSQEEFNSFEISDLAGRTVEAKTLSFPIKNVSINIGDLAKGSYLLSLKTKSGSRSSLFFQVH